MAQRKSGGSAAKKKAPARGTKAAEERARQEAAARYHRQLGALGLFAAGALLLAVAFIPGQKFWTTLHEGLFGLFGWCAYLLPLLLIYIAVLATMDKCVIKHKLWQTGGLLVLLCAATHAFAMGNWEVQGFANGFSELYQSGLELQGGGLSAGLVGVPLVALLGGTGAKVTIVILIFVFLMIITGTTLHQFMQQAVRPVKKMEEAYIQRAEERQLNPSGARFNIDVPLSSEALPQHPVQSPKATVEYTDSLRIARDKLVDFEFDENAERGKAVPPVAEEIPPPAEPDAQIEDKLGIDDIVSKAMGLEANALKPAYIAEEEPHEPGWMPQPEPVEPEAMDGVGRFRLSNEALARISKEFGPPAGVPDARVSEVPAADAVLANALEELAPTAPEPPIQLQDDAVDGMYKAKITEEGMSAYIFPPVSLLKEMKPDSADDVQDELRANAQRLVDTLCSFGVQTRIIDISRGPSVTRYELQPSAGVKISKITGLSDDIALNLASAGVRIEAPIPNKAAVGIEVPNKTVSIVGIRELIDSDVFLEAPSRLTVALGKDIGGSISTADIAKMPHLLIAGATGSGKSVCINSLIISLLYKSTPDEVRLLMIDPKVVELGIYNGIPHLLVPVVTDPRKAAGALNWAVSEMLGRYKMFADNSVRDLKGYNKLARREDNALKPMPEIVIIIDELADLMMAAPNEVEDAICRLAQMARAAGMHLVIATQRPSVDVITGVIKANIPSRIAFAVSSQVDSRTILDGGGAEKLLGRGDMLFMPVGASKPTRVQGCYVSDKEVEKVVKFVKESQNSDYDENIMSEIERQAAQEKIKSGSGGDGGGFSEDEEMLQKAIEVVVELGQASTSMLQRKLKLGYARAARLVDEMEERGIVGPFEGSKPRPVLITRQQWIEMKMNGAAVNEGVPEEI